MTYSEIHVWDFPPTKTYLRINYDYRQKLIQKYVSSFRTNIDAVAYLNKMSKKYGKEKRYSPGQTITWKKGKVKTNNKNVNMPLWTLIEISKFLSESEKSDNYVMHEIESNIEFYCGRGFSTNVSKRFPLHLTPELVSVVFNLCGDGFLADRPESSSSYRQVNKQGLMNFAAKLQNSFGKFEINQGVMNDYKILIPRVISDFYRHYFGLINLRWDVARIPESIKRMNKSFLLAGLTAFIVDEGHISDNIEIYSGNTWLLQDIGDIANRLGYITYGPRQKSKNQPREFRLYISKNSAKKLAEDIVMLRSEFRTCDLVHKQHKLDVIIARWNPDLKRKPNGVTRNNILELLSRQSATTEDLTRQLKISYAALVEHLQKLENEKLVERKVIPGVHSHYWKKSSILF